MATPFPPQTFHPFPLLPTELRLRIWDCYLSHPQILEIHTGIESMCTRYPSFTRTLTDALVHRSLNVYIIQKPSPLLKVCFEAKQYAIKHSEMIEIAREVCVRSMEPSVLAGRQHRDTITCWRVGVFPNRGRAVRAGCEVPGYPKYDSIVTNSSWWPKGHTTRVWMGNSIFRFEFDQMKLAVSGLGDDFVNRIRTITVCYEKWRLDIRPRRVLFVGPQGIQVRTESEYLELLFKLTGLREIIFTAAAPLDAQSSTGLIEAGIQEDMEFLTREAAKMGIEWEVPTWWVETDMLAFRRKFGG